MQAETWLGSILATLPLGATGKIVRQPLILDAGMLGAEHEGYHIVIERADRTKSISGRLNTVYPGPTDYTRIAVIDGRAHNLNPYDVAQLTDDWSQ